MALIQCPDCSAEVSDKAAACVRCGCPLAGAQPAEASSEEKQPPYSVGRCPACGTFETCDTVSYYERQGGVFEALFFGVLGGYFGRRVLGKGRYHCLKCSHDWE
jgi:hypothetical protein